MFIVVYGIVFNFDIFVWLLVGVDSVGECCFFSYLSNIVDFNDLMVVLFVDRIIYKYWN